MMIGSPTEEPRVLGGWAMPTLTIEYHDDAERLALEQAIAYVAQLRQVADTAPDGAVLAACEQVALTDGRRVLRATLAAALQGRVARVEQKGGPHEPAPARAATTPDTRDGTSGRSAPPSGPSI